MQRMFIETAVWEESSDTHSKLR